MTKWISSCAVAMLLVGGTFAVSQDDEKPVPIKEVMGAHKGGAKSLLQKVIKGKASEEETKKLVALYTDLGKNKPPKGDADAWKKRTAAILKAAQGVAKGDKGAAKALAKATNCKACHSAHRSN